MLPKKLASQMILLMLFTMFCSQFIIFIIFVLETDQNNIVTEKIYGNHYFIRTASAVKLMENEGSLENLFALNTYRVRFSLKEQRVFYPSEMSKFDIARSKELNHYLPDIRFEGAIRQFKPIEQRFWAALKYLKNELTGNSHVNSSNNQRAIILQSQVKLNNDKWLIMSVYDLHVFPVWISSTVIPSILFSIIFSIFAVFVVKRITSPLAELAEKANKFGKGQTIQEIPPRGPEDIQNAIIAFNTMHKRLSNVHDHRARALAAISHDIRTPLTSMRLNAEYISEKDVKQNVLQKIEEMQQICEATVTFALKDSWSEKNKHFDLTSLIESICCDFQEQGLDVNFIAAQKLSFQGRPIALKRAFSNLIKNGVQYGKHVEVHIVLLQGIVEIHIEDEGKGICDADKERMFEPFERSEQSRSRDSGGLGLGMAIARSVVRSHGGEIELNNINKGGLDVVVILPI
ncbi:HAMP domain-containing sensor histidine kinase [Paraglaciecola arctica]|uniref:HAMP domain-containing sensor histidine kinase n=1 Tax=Paraglaciecola arctica TaxID=1128911 RepID=UPI001C0798BF|nr:HAMP domain-containing sensor histidine kinase [Paraglaciecola arctica]MBU3005371.1 HAMP domain-containing histidine kinase [Paraglaciecola arctica]